MSWRATFDALVQARMRTPFAWGVHDCCLFAADCVQARTGRDPAADLRGAYRSERGALRVLARIGGLAGAGARCGAEIPPLCAGACDVGIVRDAGRELLAVCTGEVWLAPSMAQAGLAALPLDAATRAWRAA